MDIGKKLNGAFNTSEEISDYLVRRVVADKNDTILEPSFGDGVFIHAIKDQFARFDAQDRLGDQLFGVEIQEDKIGSISQEPNLNIENFVLDDFLMLEPFPVDIVIGNPPYISINKLTQPGLDNALKVLQKHDYKMPLGGSVWCPFVLHACDFLKPNGKLAFVLPFEITYVKYAKQLWRHLARNFKSLTLVRLFADMFPSLNVETILLIADGFGGETDFVNYEIYQDMKSLNQGRSIKTVDIPIYAIDNREKPFISGLLNSQILEIITRLKDRNIIRPIKEFCKFKIGYVSADSKYFHPGPETIDQFKLSERDLLPAVQNAQVIKNQFGLFLGHGDIKTKLFYPDPDHLSRSAKDYIGFGEKQQVHQRYKCRNRKPWFITPGIEIPDVILTVFHDNPKLYLNKGDYLASNSLLCGFLQSEDITQEQIAISWYNSLTLLLSELRVHSLGGGVLVFIPGETDTIEVIDPGLIDIDRDHLSSLDKKLKDDAVLDAYQLGDFFLSQVGGLSSDEISLIKETTDYLRRWRQPKYRN